MLEELAKVRESKMARTFESSPVQPVIPSSHSSPADMEEIMIGLSAAPVPSPPHIVPDQPEPAAPFPPVMQPPPEEQPMAHPSAVEVIQDAERQAAAQANPTLASLERMRRILQ